MGKIGLLELQWQINCERDSETQKMSGQCRSAIVTSIGRTNLPPRTHSQHILSSSPIMWRLICHPQVVLSSRKGDRDYIGNSNIPLVLHGCMRLCVQLSAHMVRVGHWEIGRNDERC